MIEARPSLPRRRQLILGAAGAALGAGLPGALAQASKPLVVGGLPVTCNLTLPVSCKASGGLFEYNKYNGWPEIKESLMTGRLQAAYMLAPLVMDLAMSRIKVKVVSLGHRSGAIIMVRSDSPFRT